ncbi:hypothetical protein [Pseudarthrobacter sp. NPDC058119]|uniref:hypothetical protein n=1 Tax=Pseudarthrobacter sp. NPDC058119 TaxID=3346348 RepID=UPI0036D9E741
MTADSYPPKSRNRFSSSEQEHDNARLLLQVLDRHSVLHDQLGHFSEVQRGSAMHGDDKATYPLPTSSYVRYLLMASADNLAALRSMTISAETANNLDLTLHPFAPYTLLRNAFESAGTALWIIAPARRRDRVLRTAKLEYADANMSKAALLSLGSTDPETYERRIRLVEDMVRPYPEIAWKEVTSYGVTGLLREIGEFPSLAYIRPLVKWQICSGMAHGKRWAGLLLSDMEEVGQPAASGDGTFLLSGSYKHLLLLTHNAVALQEEAIRLLLQRCTSHHKAPLPTFDQVWLNPSALKDFGELRLRP